MAHSRLRLLLFEQEIQRKFADELKSENLSKYAIGDSKDFQVRVPAIRQETRIRCTSGGARTSSVLPRCETPLAVSPRRRLRPIFRAPQREERQEARGRRRGEDALQQRRQEGKEEAARLRGEGQQDAKEAADVRLRRKVGRSGGFRVDLVHRGRRRHAASRSRQVTGMSSGA